MFTGAEQLRSLFQRSREYAELHDAYRQRGVATVLDPRDKEYTAGEDWREEHYFSVGADALRLIAAALVVNDRPPPRTILDFPSGSGRVTRHLKSFFPAARIVACDLYDYHVGFCVDALGIEGVMSNENLDEVRFDTDFDLIFCGSLLTHLPPDGFDAAVRLMARSLSDTGIAVATLQGRHALHVQRHKWQYVPDELFAVVEATYPSEGYGYVDYDHDFKAVFDQQAHYGVLVAAPHWTLRHLEARDDIRILGYTERAWDDHQDVVVFGRPALNI